MNLKYGILLLFLSIFIVACTSQSEINSDEPQEVQSEIQIREGVQDKVSDAESGLNSEKMSLNKIYNYGSVSKFTYDVIVSVNSETMKSTFDYALSSDVVDGKEAWLSVAEMDVQGSKILSKVWIDKITFGCLKSVNVVNFNGRVMENSAECPKEGPNAVSSYDKTPELEYIGMESVTVPLGSFNAKKYVLDNTIIYWYVESIPIPLKVVYTNSGTTMELVRWS
ncbi:MAG: hypothetical protein QXK76_00605 [Candidatus Woesearchaeota archaeon]